MNGHIYARTEQWTYFTFLDCPFERAHFLQPQHLLIGALPAVELYNINTSFARRVDSMEEYIV